MSVENSTPKTDEERFEELQKETEAMTEKDSAEEVVAEVEDDAVAVEMPDLAALTAQLEEKDARIARLQADFENFRRRTSKEKLEVSAVVLQGVLKDMLPLIDNFERAMAADNAAEGFKTGIEMIFQQFQEVLKKNGLERIEAEGKPFDPNFHQAVMRVKNPELEDGTISQELQKGYQAHGRVIRPSMVQVVGD